MPYFDDGEGVQLHLGDCLDVLPTIRDASIDAVVCDPPYGLEFMGKDWDGSDGFRRSLNPADVGRDSVFGRTSAKAPEYRTKAAGDQQLFQQWCEQWAAECLRVLKPGGHLLAFGAPRTYHRLACAIEDAGFEIRDSIHWVFGQGFPKSLDVAKAIDKAGGQSPADLGRTLRAARERAGLSRQQVAEALGCHPSSIGDWEDGRARALGEPREVCTPSPVYRERLAQLLGYTDDERLIVGGGGVSRGLYETGHRGIAYGAAATDRAKTWDGWGTALKPAHEPIVVARKAPIGTVAANVLEHGTGAINVDACRTAVTDSGYARNASGDRGHDQNRERQSDYRLTAGHSSDLGRWPTNLLLCHGPECVEDGACQPGCPVAELDRQSGVLKSGVLAPHHDAKPSKNTSMGGANYAGRVKRTFGGDEGGASRFFPIFRYEAKASTTERPRLADGTVHATVKPLELMRWLVRLVTPPGGTVLDPFAGSGTTGEAAILEGFHALLIEREQPYADLCVARLSKPLQPSLFGSAA